MQNKLNYVRNTKENKLSTMQREINHQTIKSKSILKNNSRSPDSKVSIYLKSSTQNK